MQKRLQHHQQQHVLQQVEVPYQAHQRIHGWKLTPPHRIMLDLIQMIPIHEIKGIIK